MGEFARKPAERNVDAGKDVGNGVSQVGGWETALLVFHKMTTLWPPHCLLHQPATPRGVSTASTCTTQSSSLHGLPSIKNYPMTSIKRHIKVSSFPITTTRQ
uniref:Uncharacterized protein n=1 Tax=Trypanosoma vivax (strain Y486) TaxID=1055687 RepID=G0UBH9_TRYVY|nr:hypothetical protein, unlikely [Trypanosoma vivax Y486]